MEYITETLDEYTLLSSAHPAGTSLDQYTATCVIQKHGKVVDRVSAGDLFSSASEANEKARMLARQRIGDWWRSS